MRKKGFLAFVMALLAAVLTALPATAEGPRLPDIGPVLGVEGELYSTSVGDSSGLPYHNYVYDKEMTLDEVSKVLVAYTEAARELGFTVKTADASKVNAIRYMAYTCDEGRAELAVVPMKNTKNLLTGGKAELRFLLCVQDSMAFELGRGTSGLVEGGTRCIECKGSGRCRYCGGSGRYDYGQGYETCVVCDGSGICNLCDGEGKY